MKTIRNIAKNKFFATAMSFLLLFVTTNSVTASNTYLNFDKDVSGEQIFREIFFFQGDNLPKDLPVSLQEHVNRFRSMSKAQLAERDKTIDNVVSIIKRSNPSYFESLKKAIQSKNPYSIKESLTQGSKQIISALKLTDKFNEMVASYEAKKMDLNQESEIEKLVSQLKAESQKNAVDQISEEACVAVAAVLVVAVVAVAAAVYMYVWALTEWYAEQKNSSIGNLSMDKYVNSIILKYS